LQRDEEEERESKSTLKSSTSIGSVYSLFFSTNIVLANVSSLHDQVVVSDSGKLAHFLRSSALLMAD
jgi:hypothetical protein